MHNIKKKLSLPLAAVCICCIFSGCSAPVSGHSTGSDTLSQITDTLFKETVTSDAITTNYLIKNPEDYGIEMDTYTFGRPYETDSEDVQSEYESLLQTLEAIEPSSLSSDEQLIREILIDTLKTNETLSQYTLLSESINPLNGDQAMLPVLLNEYTFYDEEDVSHYMELLKDTPDYFDHLLGFEQEKAQAGTFMTENILNNVIDQCQSFIDNPENNLLVTTFSGKLDDELPGLDAQTKADFMQQNEDAVMTYVIPAYESLIDGLEELRPYCSSNGCLGAFEEGKDYYTALIRSVTGTQMSPEEMIDYIDERLDEQITTMAVIAMSNPQIIQDFESAAPVSGSPEDILSQLQSNIQEDFPEAADVTYTVKYVDEALREYLSPAFYLTPPIDGYKENMIYINSEKGEDVKNIDNLFTTLAHEGFPGHLYQQTYFLDTHPDKIRAVLSYSGYSEGWATYIEMLAYDWAYDDDSIAAFMAANQKYSLLLSARLDLAIHYQQWTAEEVGQYLTDRGASSDPELIQSLYDIILQAPANYLSYAVGGAEFERLRQKAEDGLDERFNAKEFHRFILELGPAPFYIIESHLDEWINSL